MRQARSIDGSQELCYWAKSSGHNHLSRLSTEGLKRVLISWLLCTELRFLYSLVLILITSVTYGISKSFCKVWLETCQGELLIILSIFDWNVWRILVLDGLLHPHSSIPYVQMGRSIVLYTVSLRSRDSCERVVISQLVWIKIVKCRNMNACCHLRVRYAEQRKGSRLHHPSENCCHMDYKH